MKMDPAHTAESHVPMCTNTRRTITEDGILNIPSCEKIMTMKKCK
jgi:hypothetical protein